MSPNIYTGLSLPYPYGAELGEPLGATLTVETQGIVTMSPRGTGHMGQDWGPAVGRRDTDGYPRGFLRGIHVVGHQGEGTLRGAVRWSLWKCAPRASG